MNILSKYAVIILSFLVIQSCEKNELCDIEKAISNARQKMQKQIRSDTYELYEMRISKQSYTFRLNPPSGSTGSAPLMEVDRTTCKAKAISWD